MLLPQRPTLETPEEQVLYYTLALTWLWYVLGALYIVPPAAAWILLALWFSRAVSADEQLPNRPMTPLVLIWLLGMMIMLLALIIGHLSWDLGIPQLIKSSIGWMKGWALFAIFTLVGGSMHVRPQVIYRAGASVVLQTLLVIPLLAIAPIIGLPGQLYTSPVMILGGPGPEYFEVQLYSMSFDGSTRWRFFAPWPPAASVAFGVLTPLVLRDRSRVVQVLGAAVVVAVIMMSKSRLGLLAIPLALIGTLGLSRLTSPRLLVGAAVAILLIGLSAEQVTELLIEQKERMSQMRAESSYVRDALGRLAIDRWQSEAPVWGHGVVEMGPPFVEFMPIGSHHSWYGLLFVKGAVGFAALLVPMLFTFGEMLVKAQRERTARTGLCFIVLFAFFTFTENVEMLAYLIWPAFVILGIASRKRVVGSFTRPMTVLEPEVSGPLALSNVR